MPIDFDIKVYELTITAPQTFAGFFLKSENYESK